MKRLDLPPIGGYANINNFVSFDGVDALLRVPYERGIGDALSHYYYTTGFTSTDGGSVHRRSPGEQYDFSRKAAAAGLAVLPPLSLEGKNLVYPFLNQMQTLEDYLHAPDGSINLGYLFPALFEDMRKAHRLGFVYGDRAVSNILLDSQRFVHIDFDWAISGSTAREFSVAETSTYIIQHGGIDTVPVLASTLGALCAQTPEWIDIDKTAEYMRRMGEMLHKDRGLDVRIITDQEALIAATYAVRETTRSGI